MVCFETGSIAPFNDIIHNFLEVEVFSKKNGLEDIIDKTIPFYLKKEQYEKCKEVYTQLYEWTNSEIVYELSVFHNFILYYFLEYMEYLQENNKQFNKKYFNDKVHKAIEEESKLEYEEDLMKEMSLEEYKNIYYDVTFYEDYLFMDTDFSILDILYNETSTGRKKLLKRLGTSIDYYFELLPKSIQKQYRTSHITLAGDTIQMLKLMQNKINSGSLSKLFWNKERVLGLKSVQQILDNIITAYYCSQDIELFWESKINGDTLIFEFYKRREEEKKFLASFLRVDPIYLKKSYEKELMKTSENYDNSYFILLCYTNEEYKWAEKFIRENVYTDTIQLYLNITVFDLRKKRTPSKM